MQQSNTGVPIHCPDCQGFRLHRVVLARHSDGRVTREAECPTCSQTRAIPAEHKIGLSCPDPACGHIHFRTQTTRPRRGRIDRIRVCKRCGRRVRTTERIVAMV